MELKEYILIIKKNSVLFFSVIFVVVAAVLSFFYFQSETYSASILLNITRQGKDSSQGYKYDDFYRLQADEKFADTVVEWLKNPRVAADILAASEYGKSRPIKFSPVRRSSQIVSVDFKTPDRQSAEKISVAMAKIIRQNTEALNKNQQEESWFMVLAEEPIIGKYQPPYLKIFLAALFFGIFLAFFGVLIKHYSLL